MKNIIALDVGRVIGISMGSNDMWNMNAGKNHSFYVLFVPKEQNKNLICTNMHDFSMG